MNLNVDGQNQRRKFLSKFHANINKSKRTRKKKKHYNFNWGLQKIVIFWAKSKKCNKKIYCKS